MEYCHTPPTKPGWYWVRHEFKPDGVEGNLRHNGQWDIDGCVYDPGFVRVKHWFGPEIKRMLHDYSTREVELMEAIVAAAERGWSGGHEHDLGMRVLQLRKFREGDDVAPAPAPAPNPNIPFIPPPDEPVAKVEWKVPDPAIALNKEIDKLEAERYNLKGIITGLKWVITVTLGEIQNGRH